MIFLRFLVRGVFITALRLGFVVLAQDKKLDRIRIESLRHDAPWHAAGADVPYCFAQAQPRS